jgi:H+/Na+-translocating ferredoxin:NAD+ oxidoreductase subunit C
MQRPLRVMPSPQHAVVAMDQGNGRGAEPIVAVGDRVRIGTTIGRSSSDAAVDVHSPIAGVVRSIELRPIPGPGGSSLCVLIDADGSGESERGSARLEWQAMPADQLLARIRAAGIAGLGGAAFPAHAKIAAARTQSAAHLVLNGAECEPWICCDDALMRERAEDVLLGARVILQACGATECTIAVEDDKPEAIAAIEQALARAADARISLRALPAVYPAGAERQLLAAVTGREVPTAALPPSVGLLCQNVGTAAAVARLVRTGEPLTRRIVTVTGSGVNEPANVEACIGTSISELVAACGGYEPGPLRLIAGGSMTGRALASDDVPLTQGVNCVFVATAADLRQRGAEMPCIRCGDCATVCPAGLLPQSLLRAVAADDEHGLDRYGLADCIECGCCDYVCPSQIPLTARFVAARRAQSLRLEQQRRASEARERFAKHQLRLAEAAEAERRAFEDARRRARGEVTD